MHSSAQQSIGLTKQRKEIEIWLTKNVKRRRWNLTATTAKTAKTAISRGVECIVDRRWQVMMKRLYYFASLQRSSLMSAVFASERKCKTIEWMGDRGIECISDTRNFLHRFSLPDASTCRGNNSIEKKLRRRKRMVNIARIHIIANDCRWFIPRLRFLTFFNCSWQQQKYFSADASSLAALADCY